MSDIIKINIIQSLKSLVRAVGIEPTLLSEPDFEWDAPHLNNCNY
jgi:hypothetical protein